MKSVSVPFKIIKQLIKGLETDINYLDYTDLDLSSLEIKTIPDWVFEFKNLKVLSAPNNHIQLISNQIKELKELRVLILNNNYLQKLPIEITMLTKLKLLHLGNNNFFQFPVEVLRLPQLKKLWLNNNNIKNIPHDDLAKKTSLSKVYIKNNPVPFDEAFVINLGSEYYRTFLQSLRLKNEISPDDKRMKIKRLHISNIGHFDELDLAFNDGITCLIGLNGTGKTTILRSLALGLMGYDRQIAREKGILEDKIVQLLKFKSYSEREPLGKIELECTINGNSIKNVIVFDSEDKNEPIKTITPASIEILNPDNQPRTLMIGFGQNRTGNEYSRNTLSPLINNMGDNRLEKFSQWIIDNFAEANKKAANSINNETIVEYKIIEKTFVILSKILGEEIVFTTVENNDQVIVETKYNPNGIDIYLLSQGFQDIIGWIGYFIQQMAVTYPEVEDFTKEYAICLVDEIDIFLHPKWQYGLIKPLAEEFPNTQFIITSHSAIIASSFEPSEIISMKFDSDGNVYQDKGYKGENGVNEANIPNPKYLRWDAILTKVFDLENDGPVERQKLLSQLAFVDEKINYLKENNKTNELKVAVEEYKTIADKLAWKIDDNL